MLRNMIGKSILSEGIHTALESREMAMTHRSKVGGALHSQLGWQGGFNIERKNYTSIHAERNALIKDMARGLRWNDFDYYVEIYQDASTTKSEIFPMCPDCWKWYRAFVDPQITIVVADTSGNVQYQCKLDDIKPPGNAEVYPSDLMRITKPLHNFEQLGNKIPWQTEFHMNNSKDLDSVVKVALSFKGRGIVFDQVPQLMFDSVAVCTKDLKVYGGYLAQTHMYDVILGTTTAMVAATSDKYNGTDFKTFVGVVPGYVKKEQVVGFLGNVMNEWSELIEFGHPRIKIVAITGFGEQVYSGSLSEINSHYRETGEFSRALKIMRRRMNSEPRL